MRRPMLFASAIVFVAALLAGGLLSVVRAQDATPAAMEIAAGVTFEPIAGGAADTLPPAPVTLELVRFRFEPGAVLAVPADDPSLVLAYTESGTITWNLTAPVVISRAANGTQEEVAAGTTFTTGPGDSFVGPANAGGELRNDGEEPAVLLTARITPIEAGTPTA